MPCCLFARKARGCDAVGCSAVLACAGRGLGRWTPEPRREEEPQGHAKAGHAPGARHHPRDHQEVEEHRSEEHTSELQSLMRISYAVFCLKQKTKTKSPEK